MHALCYDGEPKAHVPASANSIPLLPAYKTLSSVSKKKMGWPRIIYYPYHHHHLPSDAFIILREKVLQPAIEDDLAPLSEIKRNHAMNA